MIRVQVKDHVPKVKFEGSEEELMSEFILLFKCLEKKYAEIGVNFKKVAFGILNDKNLKNFSKLWDN